MFPPNFGEAFSPGSLDLSTNNILEERLSVIRNSCSISQTLNDVYLAICDLYPDWFDSNIGKFEPIFNQPAVAQSFSILTNSDSCLGWLTGFKNFRDWTWTNLVMFIFRLWWWRRITIAISKPIKRWIEHFYSRERFSQFLLRRSICKIIQKYCYQCQSNTIYSISRVTSPSSNDFWPVGGHWTYSRWWKSYFQFQVYNNCISFMDANNQGRIFDLLEFL